MPGPRLWQRYNGVWYVILPGDRRITLKTRDHDVAVKHFHKHRRLWYDGKLATIAGAKNVKLGKFKTEYLKSRENKAASTLRNDETVLDHLVAALGPDRTLRSISVRDIEQFKAGLLKGLEATTVNGYLRHLRTMFATALRWEYVLKNVAAAVPFELEPEREAPPVIDEVLKAILEKAADPERRAFRILLYTGLRPFELCRLTYGHIVGGVIRVKGKRGRIRTIPLLGEAAALIGEGKKGEHVIPWRHRDTLSHKFRAAATAAGYPGVRLYDLRHTFGTVLAIAGVDPYHLSKLMGHTSISTTQRYVTVTPRHLEVVVGKLDGAFGEGNPVGNSANKISGL